jgi:hypothetical protein
MPKPLNADWGLAEVLYIQGVAYKAIAAKVGVTEASLRQRAHRYRWSALRTAALRAVSETVTGHTGMTLIERSRQVRGTLAEDLVESANALRGTAIEPGLAHLGERVEVAQKLASSAGKVFGWDSDSKPGALIIMGQMAGTDPDDAKPATPIEATVTPTPESSAQKIPEPS